MPVINHLLLTLEIILNRFLRLDPELVKHLHPLSGRVVKLELGALSHYWLFKSDAIYLAKDYGGIADLILSGSVLDFMQLACMKKELALTAIPIQVSGDMEFAKQFNELFANLEIDWEEQLSRIIGDTFAYPLAYFLKTLSQWAKQSVASFGQNLSEYLQAEAAYLVSEEELQIFFSEVDDLRDDLARLEARLARLQKDDA
jgi:ubiquinone biosynthesis accessory factor UbiJ